MNIRQFWQIIMQISGLYYAIIRYNNKTIDVETYIPEVIYSPPFKGEWYIVNGGVTKEISHSWDILPQRFAYDFIVVDDVGATSHGDKKDLNSYLCYGKEVLAPADGVVVSAKNHFPDCRIMDNGRPDPSTPDIGGNRITIKHSDKEYSTLCHLMPESITVQPGQEVKRGDIIARCGNSGNTTEPHIHFQVQNTAGFYSCLGLPIRFRNIQTQKFEKYSEIDPRPYPENGEINENYVHRGQLITST